MSNAKANMAARNASKAAKAAAKAKASGATMLSSDTPATPATPAKGKPTNAVQAVQTVNALQALVHARFGAPSQACHVAWNECSASKSAKVMAFHALFACVGLQRSTAVTRLHTCTQALATERNAERLTKEIWRKDDKGYKLSGCTQPYAQKAVWGMAYDECTSDKIAYLEQARAACTQYIDVMLEAMQGDKVLGAKFEGITTDKVNQHLELCITANAPR